MASTVVRLDIPPDHHPAAIRGDSPGANLGRDALAALYDACGKINDTAAKVADKGRLASAAQPFAEQAVARAGRAAATLRQQVEHLDKEIEAAITKGKTSPQAAEVRAYWQAHAAARNARELERIHAIVQSGDLTTISAILSAPAYLAGLTDEQQGMLRVMAARRIAPEHTARRAEAADALARVERASEHFMATVASQLRSWRDDDARIITEALR